MGVEPGAVFFIERRGDVLQLARAESPFDGLAQHAIKEYSAGRTRSLRDIAQEQGDESGVPDWAARGIL